MKMENAGVPKLEKLNNWKLTDGRRFASLAPQWVVRAPKLLPNSNPKVPGFNLSRTTRRYVLFFRDSLRFVASFFLDSH